MVSLFLSWGGGGDPPASEEECEVLCVCDSHGGATVKAVIWLP